MSRQHAVVPKRNLPSPRMRSEKENKSSSLLPFIISLGIYFVALCVLSLILSYFLYQKSDPQKYVNLMSMIASISASLIAAAYLCRATGKSPIACGIIISATVLSVSILFSFIFKSQITQPIYKGILLKIPLIFSSFLGGAIGKRKEKRGRCCGR